MQLAIQPPMTNSYKPIQLENIPDKLELERGETVYIHRTEMPILSKQALVTHFKLANNRALRSRVFTDKILRELGMELDDWKRLASFDLYQSARIYELLNITWLRTGLKPRHGKG